MNKFAGLFSGIAGVLVLVGEFVPGLDKYYLVPIGGVLALLVSIVLFKRSY